MKPDFKRVERVIKTVVKGAGYELWGIEFVTNQGKPVLRVYIEGPDGIDLKGITKVSRLLSPALDVEDPIPFTYTLEVSSPGLDRKIFTIKQYDSLRDSKVKIKLKHPDSNGRKRFTGVLKGVEGQEIILLIDNEKKRLNFNDIEEGRVVFELNPNLL